MNHEKSRILAYLQRLRAAEPRHLWASVGVGTVALLSVVAAFGTAPDSTQLLARQQEQIETLALPAATPAELVQTAFAREEQIRSGDTAAALFSRLGITDAEALDSLRANPGTHAMFRQMAPGKTVTAYVRGDGSLESLIFPLNGSESRALFIEQADGTHYKVSEHSLKLETQIVMKSAVIEHSLFGATDEAGIPDAVATQLATIFGGDIDFHRDLRQGDRLSVIYESINHLGKPMQSGHILAAEFVNGGRSYRATWFNDGQGKGAYYTPDGKSLQKAFLRSPLEFSRITSGFSSARFHPVLQRLRAHKGIDYGAPIGTKVKATADGIVAFVGNQGGYGKVIVLRHRDRYTTLYGHLSRFATGLKVGSRISQGEVIGYVGATGLATGPHLHYEFRVHGVHKNPLAVAAPDAPPLSQQQLARFRDITALQLAKLDLIRDSDLGALE